MKTKLNYLLWLLAFIPLAFTACDDDETIIEDTTIQPSVASVSFTKDGGDQSITITTNATQWVATSPVEGTWLTLTVNGNQLGVKAAANTGSADRKSFILINAGNAAAKIEVMQSAGDVALFLTPEEVAFDKAGGEKRIDVVGTNDFKLEKEGADWLTFNYTDGADFFTVSAPAYDGNEPRTGKVILTAGTTLKELTVTQTGEDLVLLPLFAKEAGMLDVMRFEEARGSKVMTMPDVLFNPNQFFYVTTNPNFPQIAYMVNITGNYQQAMTATTNKDLAPEIKKALEAQGFTLASGEFSHAEYPYVVTVQEDADGLVINSIYKPKQDKAYPTFTELPLKKQMEWTGFPPVVEPGSFEADVKPWEAANGGIFAPEESDFVENMYAVFKLSDELMATGALERGYWVEEAAPDKVSSARYIFSKIDLVYWTPDGNTYYLTDEFAKFIADNGFTFFTDQDKFKMYVKPDPQGRGFMDVLGFRMVQFSDAFDGQVVLDFQTFKNEDLVSGSLSSILTNKDKLVKFLGTLSNQLLENQKRDVYEVAK